MDRNKCDFKHNYLASQFFSLVEQESDINFLVHRKKEVEN